MTIFDVFDRFLVYFLVFFVAILNGMQVSKTDQNHQNLTLFSLAERG